MFGNDNDARTLRLLPNLNLMPLVKKLHNNSGQWRFTIQDLVENHAFLRQQLEAMGRLSVRKEGGASSESIRLLQAMLDKLDGMSARGAA
jgi:hypothetical protein